MMPEPKVILQHLKKELLDDSHQNASMWLHNIEAQDRTHLVFQAIKLMRRFSLDDETMKRMLQIKFFLTMAEAAELLEKERQAGSTSCMKQI